MRVISIVVAIAMLAAALVPAAAQQAPAAQTAPIHIGPVYTRGDESGAYPQYPDLQIEVDGPAGPDIAPGQFRLRADKGPAVAATRVQSLASTQYGIAASVSLDVSGSMAGRPLNAVRSGLVKFVNDAGPKDKIAIQTIADEGRWDADWDAPRPQVTAALDRLTTRGNLTRLWDSLFAALQHFPQTPLSRRLIVISDGHDEGSSHSEQDVIALARQRGAIVDSIGITREHHDHLLELERLALQTGGQFRKAVNSDDLEKLVGGGIQHVKATPVVSFHLDDLKGDGKLHHLEVTWTHNGSQSTAETTAVIPIVSLWKKWYWAIAIAAAILLLVIAMMRKRSPAQFTGMPPVPAPQPAATPAPVPSTDLKPASTPPRPFVPAAGGSLPPRKVPLSGGEQTPPPQRAKTQMIVRFPAPAKGRPAAWLLCEEGFAPGRRFPVDEIEYWIGSLENNHLRITDDPTVSANHACVMFDHEVLGIHDHQSTNGTRVNGEVVGDKRRLLRIGDRIRIGRSTFLLQPAEEGAPS